MYGDENDHRPRHVPRDEKPEEYSKEITLPSELTHPRSERQEILLRST